MYNNPYSNMPVYNPNLTPQQRVNQMEQIFQPMQQLQQPQGLNTIVVTDIAEANATPVDTLNGTPTFFYNKAKNEFYLKQYNSQTGMPIFLKFQPVQTPQNECKEQKGINTYEKDFEALNKQINSLNKKIDNMYLLLSKNDDKGGKNATK